MTTTYLDAKVADIRVILARRSDGPRRLAAMDKLLARHPLPAGTTEAERGIVSRALTMILDASDAQLRQIEEA